MAIYPNDLDLAPFEERLRQCFGNAAVAIRGFYPQDVTALVNEIKRLRIEREVMLTGVKGEPIEAGPATTSKSRTTWSERSPRSRKMPTP